MIEKYIYDGTLDGDELVTDVSDTLDGFERDIARVDTHMEYAHRSLRRQRKKYNKAMRRYGEAMRRLKADRRQRVRDLAAFKAGVSTDLVKLGAVMTDDPSQHVDHVDSERAPFSPFQEL